MGLLSSRRSFCLWILALLAGVIVAQRLHTAREPLPNDITYYALIGHELRLGRTLYNDLIDHKPPAVYVSFAAAELLAGFGPRSVLLLNIAAALVTLIGVFAAGYALRKEVSTGLWAAVIWTLISGDLKFEANQPNVEVFLNGCLVWAFAALARRERWTARDSLRVGFLFGLAMLYWQAAAAVVGCLLVSQMLWPAQRTGRWLDRLRPALEIAAVITVMWSLVVLYFAATGRGKAFYELLVTFNRFYVQRTGSLLHHFLISFHPPILPTDLYHGTSLFFIPLVLLILSGLAVGWREPSRRGWKIWLAYALGTHLAVSLPGNYFSHYYQLWLPVLAIAAGWSMSAIPFMGLATAGCLLVHEARFYRLPAAQWSQEKYGAEYSVTQKVGRDLQELLLPSESFYEWGLQSGLYYWSGHRPPTGAFYGYFLMTGPLAQQLSERVLGELKQNPPELFMAIHWVWPGASLYEFHPVYQWATRHYRPFEWEHHRGSFLFFARRGGELEARIARRAVPARFLAP